MREIIRDQLNRSVPFASHTGIAIDEIRDGEAIASLEQSDITINHIGTQHAGALFTLGETASGAAMAGVFAEKLLAIRPLAANATIAYSRIAKGTITARATISDKATSLRDALDEVGKVTFMVTVSLSDRDGEQVAKMNVDWYVSLNEQ